MKKIALLVEELILELTANEIKKKYYSDISQNDFNDIVSADPKTINKNGEIFVELTNKETNKTINGMTKIESLPSHFSNYKLFEHISRMKKLI